MYTKKSRFCLLSEYKKVKKKKRRDKKKRNVEKEFIKARGCNKRLKSPRILNSLLQKNKRREERGQLEKGGLFLYKVLYDKYAQITLVDCKLT